MNQLSISAKNLGTLALAQSCPRCNWLRLRLDNKLPYQIFPGIFSTIDSYTKRVVNTSIMRHGGCPPWLSDIGSIQQSLKTPSHHTFNTIFDEINIRLTGSMDALFLLADGTLCVADYKTARYTANQDYLAPMYVVQLNGYAVIAERLKMGKVSKLGLIYFEPQTEDDDCTNDANHRTTGFAMGFCAHIASVELNPDRWLFPYLKQARELADMAHPPAHNQGCKDCTIVSHVVSLLRE